jgi:hypothetical protein
MRALSAAIAAADLASDDRGAEGMFGPPVGCINQIRLEQEREDGGEFDGQMRGKMAGDSRRPGSIDERIELIHEMSASDSQAMGRDASVLIAVAHAERVLQQSLHVRRKVAFLMLADQRATASQQVRETRLMDGAGESTIRRPAIADHHAGEVGAEYRGRLLKAAPTLNRVPRGVGRRERPTTSAAARRLSSRFHRASPQGSRE